jgi:hypothetical protein
MQISIVRFQVQLLIRANRGNGELNDPPMLSESEQRLGAKQRSLPDRYISRKLKPDGLWA